MKRLYILVCLTLCVLCVTAAKKAETLSTTQQLERSLMASASLLKGVNIFVPETKKSYIETGSELLVDAAYTVSRTEQLIADLKKVRTIAQYINTQGQCFVGAKKGDACAAVNCLSKKQCAEMLLVSIHELLMPFVQDVLGKVESSKGTDGKTKKTVKPGLVIGLASSTVVPQSYRISWTQILGDFTIKLSDGIAFLPKLGAMINPAKKTKDESSEKQSFRDEPIVLREDDFMSSIKSGKEEEFDLD